MRLIGGLAPDFKTVADFRKNNAIKKAFSRFSMLCDGLGLIGKEMVAVGGGKFRADNSSDKYCTTKKTKILYALLIACQKVVTQSGSYSRNSITKQKDFYQPCYGSCWKYWVKAIAQQVPLIAIRLKKKAKKPQAEWVCSPPAFIGFILSSI